MKPKKVLISGAEGYIALHLARMLRNNDYDVVTASRGGSSNLRMDFAKPSEVASLRIDGIDTMIHTVSPNEALYRSDPYYALSENAAGIRAAFEFCVNNRIRNFIYLSSFHVFGYQGGVLDENKAAAPRNDYGLAHLTAEQTVQMFNRAGQVNAWIVRPSNLYGVPVNCDTFKRWNLIPFAFCKEAAERNTITLQTPGHQLRNFVGVSDVCKKVMWILERQPSERLYHAYGKDTMSVWQYAALVQNVAFDEFQLPVRIIRPDGNDRVVEFKYSSIYDIPGLEPVDEIKPFVKEMLQVLLDRKGD